MDPERWRKIEQIFHAVLEAEPSQRARILEESCARDESLRSDVESLLAHHGKASNFIAKPAFASEQQAPRSSLAKGAVIAQYRVLEKIGSGGMGEVYRAHDNRLNREVAIKVLPDSLASDPDRLRRFEQEARAAAALNHPNILAVHQMATHEGFSYLVSELLEGETLRERLRHGPVSFRKAVDYAVQIAHGLAVAHEKGIVHRDLKPENLFLCKDGRVKILDFGLARIVQSKAYSAAAPTLSRATDSGMVMGTVGYMSPEQVRGKPADHRSDIFAFGTVLYEVVTGTPAFRRTTSPDTMAAILKEEPPSISQFVPDTPPGLQRIIQRCLEKAPEQRFQSASDLAFALEALSDSGTGPVPPFPPEPQRRWKWIALAAGAIAAATGFAVWWELPPPVPVVTAITQLTDDGLPKWAGLATDGSRIYFGEGERGSLYIAQVAVSGGQTSVIPTRLASPLIMGVSQDGSSLLAIDGSDYRPSSLWTIPLPTGDPHRLGDIEAARAEFSPDGGVVFTDGAGLYAAERDGSNVRQLRAATSFAADELDGVSVSRDGRLAFVIHAKGDSPSSFTLMESGPNGSAHTVDTSVAGTPHWTPDGRFLLYRKLHLNRSDIWLAVAQTGFFPGVRKSIQLTNGPLHFSSVIPSRDGSRIFAIGLKGRGELVRYDRKLKQFSPFLSGISAVFPSFSRDGKWVAYTSYPDRTLWRSRADGTDRLQLTYLPVQVAGAVISPDGKQVSFATTGGGIYVVSMEGGPSREIVKDSSSINCWSPDGNSLMMTSQIEGKNLREKNALELRTLDLRNGKFAVVPGSRGLNGGCWVTQDTLVAITEDLTRILTFDFKAQKWDELAANLGGTMDSAEFSVDRQYLYYTTPGANPKAMRIRFADHAVETIASLKELNRTSDAMTYPGISVAPDGSPVFTREIPGSQEIYALDVNWP